MGLIAREIERRGIPTLCMTSAWSITRAVNPPRAAFLDFPLGHTTGKPHDPSLQRAILRQSLRAFEDLKQPGEIVTLPFAWAEDDDWKDRAMRSASDDRIERHHEPQYQSDTDRAMAARTLAEGGCSTCVFL